jgi:cytoplasmic iron level regulating protein YaaA (DUF328/UPF0246 family)
MKIIVSPAKKQQNRTRLKVAFKESIFREKTQELLKLLKHLSREELGKALNIKNQLLDETYHKIKTYENTEVTHGISLYTGVVFQGLASLKYTEKELAYLSEHVRILSAFYGVVHPFDAVKPYRLDMKSDLVQGGLYKFWNGAIGHLFKDEVIINLASTEFSKLIKEPMTNILFKEESESGKFKVVGTYAKQARGKMLCWMIENQVTSIEEIKLFKGSGYGFNKALSTKNNLVFTRSKNFSLKKSD